MMQLDEKELVLSDRMTVTVRELNGYQVSKADLLIADEIGEIDPELVSNESFQAKMALKSSLLQSNIYAVCSILKLNGEAVTPLRNQAQYMFTAERLTSREMDKLVTWGRSVYSDDAATAKKDPGSTLETE